MAYLRTTNKLNLNELRDKQVFRTSFAVKTLEKISKKQRESYRESASKEYLEELFHSMHLDSLVSGTSYVRTRLREEGFARRILIPTNLETINTESTNNE